jgi:hypothetical protein
MSIILQVDNSDVDIESTSVEDSFMILDADGVAETSPPDDSAPASEESRSESSDSSFLDIYLDDEIEDEDDTTQSIELDEHQVNQELEEVSNYMVGVILKLHYKILSL